MLLILFKLSVTGIVLSFIFGKMLAPFLDDFFAGCLGISLLGFLSWALASMWILL